MLRPRFVGRTSVADTVTVANAMLGFAACALAFLDPALSARAILLAAVADGLDGVLARQFGKTQMGEFLDSLADVASFGVAPALFVFSVVDGPTASATTLALATVVPAAYVGMAVLRLGLYTAYDIGARTTEGVQTTLAATLLSVAYLAGVGGTALLVATGVFAYLMVTEIPYPELYQRDALAMGAIQAGAVFAPRVLHRALPRLLLVAALAYLVLGPFVYWRDDPAAE